MGPKRTIPALLDVVLERNAHQQEQKSHPQDVRDLPHAQRDRSSDDALHDEEQEVAAIEHGDGEQVEQTQVDADERHDPDEVVRPLATLLPGDLIDRDRTADFLEADLALHQAPQSNGHEARDSYGLLDGLFEGIAVGLGMFDARLE